jgi:hypothetical protein
MVPPFWGGGGLNLSFGVGLEPGVEDEVRCVPHPGNTPNLILYPGL